MALRINTNPTSLRAQTNLNKTQSALTHNIERLSSGLRINRASDDAAGSSISTKLSADVRSLKVAQRNANDAISVFQTAEGAANEVAGILTRMRELAVQAANEGVMTSSERGYLQQEFALLSSEIDRIVQVTEFNGQELLDGTFSKQDFQVGMNGTSHDRIVVTVGSLGTEGLGIDGEKIDAASDAWDAIDALDDALDTVSTTRGSLGTAQNRMTMTLSNLANMHENLSAANSRIKDVDVAEESAGMTRNQILQQAGVSVLAQANTLPQAALSLIG